jgi:hypothetical protein
VSKAQAFAVAFIALVLIGFNLKLVDDVHKLQRVVADKDRINADLARHMILSTCTTMSARRVLEIVDQYRDIPRVMVDVLAAERRSYKECRDI